MMPKGQVAARLMKQQPNEASWLLGGSMPQQLKEDAAQRLGVLGLLMALILGIFFAVFFPRNSLFTSTTQSHLAPPIGVAIAIFASLTIFFLSRKLRNRTQLLLNLGEGYKILIAAIVGFLNHLNSWKNIGYISGWSGVAVWVIIYTVIVPSTPRRTIVLASIAALMDPLMLMLNVGLGNPMPSMQMMLPLFVPTLFAVVTATVASRISCRMGRDVAQARELGSYQLVELLGKGGMGEVWRAEHKLLARPAAIKLIRWDNLAAGIINQKGDAVSEEAEVVFRRFEREARATAQLESQHTIEIYDFGISTEGSFYYVMELLNGLDLEQLVLRFGAISPARTVHILLQVCDSLAEAHNRGLIHRDIKPANIYVCRQALNYDVVKVLDFGLVKQSMIESDNVKLTADDTLSGTPAYMAPEIIAGMTAIDGRADLYALGCVGYWLLSGKLVFESKNAVQMIIMHASEEPTPLSERADQPIPTELESVIHACLNKDPAQRPANALELAARLRSVALDEPWTQERAAEWWKSQGESKPPGNIDIPVDPLGSTIRP